MQSQGIHRAKPALLFLVAVLLLCTPFTMRAHHSTAAQFDTSRTVKVTGIISKLDWANPHVHVLMDVKTEHWDVELASPGGIVVAGLSKDLLKPGTTVTITGYPGKIPLSICAKELT